jgi:hypothetical protein
VNRYSSRTLLLAATSLFATACSSSDNDDDGTIEARPDGGAQDSGAFDDGGFADSGEPPLQDAGLADACERAGLECTEGQRCDTEGDEPACADNSCDDLECGAGQDCRPAAQGSGWVCVSAPCGDDVDCADAEYCDGETCRLDVCIALERTCDGDSVLACNAVGAGEEPLFACAGGGYFVSSCVTDAAGQAACGCEDDWDCPAFTECEVSQCVGTGREPTCTLPPVDFESVPPALEIHWGGDDPADIAHDGTLPSAAAPDAPWPAFTHVVNTPIVANLDDDNGDGLINELDFPEIVFMAHQGNTPWRDAVVRAIHGGGPHKGADYFARCGDALWQEGDPVPADCAPSTPTADAGAPVAVGDLDGDGLPEIVVPLENDRFQILDHTGALIFTLASAWNPASSEGETIAIANLDLAGYAEIIVGPHVFLLGDDAISGALIVTHVLTGSKSVGLNDGVSFMACPADLDTTRAGLEIAVGTTLYALPASVAACVSPPCVGALQELWHAPDIGTQSTELNSGAGTDDGYCAVADIWGADFGASPGPANPPDGKPEVILIANGNLVTLDGATGTLIDIRGLGGERGGAPNVDDFDGDGFMEVASALQDYYIVVDLQDPEPTHCAAWPTPLPRDPAGANPNTSRTPGGTDVAGNCSADTDCNTGAVCGAAGTCVCLHSGWSRDSDDDSSRATSSSVFDFNGDGSAEVVYNDECEVRVFRGSDGTVLYNEPSRSRTGIENSVVADVDNDGNAEIIVGSNNAVADRCDEDGDTPTGVNGLRVFGDPTDTWVAARRVWNQQSYHVTNVNESGGIPEHEAESWRVLNGRTYNTYRSQPRSFGVAPDLAVTGIGVSAEGGCAADLLDEFEPGDSSVVQISFEITNLGDLRVGPGVDVALVGQWDMEALEEALHADGVGTPLTVTLQESLEPGASVVITVDYDVMHNAPGRLPDTIRVTVDSMGDERECVEDNNSRDYVPADDSQQTDLRLVIDSVAGCPDATVEAHVFNDGVDFDGTFTIVWYAGNPSQGGSVLGETSVDVSIASGDSVAVEGTLEAFPRRGAIVVFGVVDPDKRLDDCARGNNTAAAPMPHSCAIIVD